MTADNAPRAKPGVNRPPRAPGRRTSVSARSFASTIVQAIRLRQTYHGIGQWNARFSSDGIRILGRRHPPL